MGRFHSDLDSDGEETAIDLSPLIDCVFILLIFFIVTTVFVEETGVEIDRPQAASAVQLEKTSMLIALTDSGQVVYGDREIGIAGVQGAVRRELQKDKDIPVIVQADESAPAGLLVQIVGEAKLAGATKVSAATEMRRN